MTWRSAPLREAAEREWSKILWQRKHTEVLKVVEQTEWTRGNVENKKSEDII